MPHPVRAGPRRAAHHPTGHMKNDAMGKMDKMEKKGGMIKDEMKK